MGKIGKCVVAAASCCAALGMLAPPSWSDKPATGSCPGGFDIGAVARADYTSLPRSAAAIDDGLVDEAFLLAGFDRFDKNANGIVCVQLSVGFETNQRPVGEYLYNVVDDTARSS